MKTKTVYSLIFATSLAYAPFLSWWQRKDPKGFNDQTWLTVVIGVGYVLLYLRLLLNLAAWLRVCFAFFFACVPIITRSLLQSSEHNQQLQRFIENGGRDA